MHYYFAPMEGITTYVFRNAYHHYYGGITKYYTPFLSNKVLSTKEIRDILPQNNESLTLVPQILTNQADTFLEIANVLANYGYCEVNLNLGCPSGTVVAKNRGSGFLKLPERLDSFLDEIYRKCSLDISIKTRIGIESLYEWEDLLNIFKKYPIKEFIIHPRLQKEFYKGSPHWDSFLQAVEVLKDTSIPVCYNGDIHTVDRYHQLQDFVPSLQTVMLGRGLLSNPTLVHQIKGTLSSTATRDVFFDFHNEILAGYQSYMSGDQPVLFKMKELWSYWQNYIRIEDKTLKKIRKTNRLSEYRGIIQTIQSTPEISLC